MPTLIDLQNETTIFFNKHWGSTDTPPMWTVWQNFLSASVPNYDKGGCYALFEGNSLVYVGVGISLGSGLYIQHGISRRMMSHVYCSNKSKGKNQLKLTGIWTQRNITSCATIGFDADITYLAAALEVFLIRKLRPAHNKIK